MIINTTNTRIVLKYDLLSVWNESPLILKKGEVAIAEIPQNTIDGTNHTSENTLPVIAMKVGDGVRVFKQLPWVQAVAGDVYDWAKKPNTPTLGELTNIDADLKTEIDKILGQYGEIQDTDTYYKVEADNDKIGDKHHFKLSAYKKDGTPDTAKDIVINWSDIDTQMAGKQDKLAAIDGGELSITATNPVATKATVTNAIEASEAKLQAIATSGNVNDLIQTADDVLIFNCGSATTVI